MSTLDLGFAIIGGVVLVVVVIAVAGVVATLPAALKEAWRFWWPPDFWEVVEATLKIGLAVGVLLVLWGTGSLQELFK